MVVEIPILPHVKSLLTALYGKEPIAVHENTLLGKELENILLPYSQTEIFPPRPIPGSIKLAVSVRLYPYFVRFNEAFSAGVYFEKMFHSFLFMYVTASIEAGVKQEKAIKNFYTRYNIDEELYDYSAARMSLTRMRR